MHQLRRLDDGLDRGEGLTLSIIDRRPGLPPNRTLLPLLGDASPTLSASRHRLDVPAWPGPQLPPEDAERLTPDDPTSWDAVTDYLAVMSQSEHPESRRVATWRLALAHLALGLPREADSYLGRLEDEPVPQLPVSLLRARSGGRLSDMMASR